MSKCGLGRAAASDAHVRWAEAPRPVEERPRAHGQVATSVISQDDAAPALSLFREGGWEMQPPQDAQTMPPVASCARCSRERREAHIASLRCGGPGPCDRPPRSPPPPAKAVAIDDAGMAPPPPHDGCALASHVGRTGVYYRHRHAAPMGGHRCTLTLAIVVAGSLCSPARASRRAPAASTRGPRACQGTASASALVALMRTGRGPPRPPPPIRLFVQRRSLPPAPPALGLRARCATVLQPLAVADSGSHRVPSVSADANAGPMVPGRHHPHAARQHRRRCQRRAFQRAQKSLGGHIGCPDAGTIRVPSASATDRANAAEHSATPCAGPKPAPPPVPTPGLPRGSMRAPRPWRLGVALSRRGLPPVIHLFDRAGAAPPMPRMAMGSTPLALLRARLPCASTGTDANVEPLGAPLYASSCRYRRRELRCGHHLRVPNASGTNSANAGTRSASLSAGIACVPNASATAGANAETQHELHADTSTAMVRGARQETPPARCPSHSSVRDRHRAAHAAQSNWAGQVQGWLLELLPLLFAIPKRPVLSTTCGRRSRLSLRPPPGVVHPHPTAPRNSRRAAAVAARPHRPPQPHQVAKALTHLTPRCRQRNPKGAPDLAGEGA